MSDDYAILGSLMCHHWTTALELFLQTVYILLIVGSKYKAHGVAHILDGLLAQP
jgi:hypothetical protein